MTEDYPLQRQNYKEFGGNFDRDSFFSKDGYGVVSDKFGIQREGFD